MFKLANKIGIQNIIFIIYLIIFIADISYGALYILVRGKINPQISKIVSEINIFLSASCFLPAPGILLETICSIDNYTIDKPIIMNYQPMLIYIVILSSIFISIGVFILDHTPKPHYAEYKVILSDNSSKANDANSKINENNTNSFDNMNPPNNTNCTSRNTLYPNINSSYTNNNAFTSNNNNLFVNNTSDTPDNINLNINSNIANNNSNITPSADITTTSGNNN